MFFSTDVFFVYLYQGDKLYRYVIDSSALTVDARRSCARHATG